MVFWNVLEGSENGMPMTEFIQGILSEHMKLEDAESIGHFTVVCFNSVLAWIESEAGVDLVLIETSLLFLCKCQLVSKRTA